MEQVEFLPASLLLAASAPRPQLQKPTAQGSRTHHASHHEPLMDQRVSARGCDARHHDYPPEAARLALRKPELIRTESVV